MFMFYACSSRKNTRFRSISTIGLAQPTETRPFNHITPSFPSFSKPILTYFFHSPLLILQQQREDIVEHVVVDDVEPPAGPSPRPELSAEEIVANRGGDVLLRHTILKSDYFPGCHNQKLTPQLDGAPNFRQVAYLPVYGVAIPTVSGLRTVLDFLGAAKGRRKVLWFNLPLNNSL